MYFTGGLYDAIPLLEKAESEKIDQARRAQHASSLLTGGIDFRFQVRVRTPQLAAVGIGDVIIVLFDNLAIDCEICLGLIPLS